jgi:hypothetical protein
MARKTFLENYRFCANYIGNTQLTIDVSMRVWSACHVKIERWIDGEQIAKGKLRSSLRGEVTE